MATVIALAVHRSRPATVITVHSHKLGSIAGGRSLRGALTRWALRRFDAVVAVSDGVAAALALAIPEVQVRVIPAYLGLGDEPRSDLSEPTRTFLAAGRPTLLVAAYRLNTDSRGELIYGVDFAFELFARLAAQHPGLRLAIFLAKPPNGPAERRRLQHLLQHAATQGVADRVRIATAEPLAPALTFDSIVLRPSRTDGDAVTVREALAAGRPVIASNAVQRPDGVEALPLDHVVWSTAIGKLLSEPQLSRPKPPQRTHGTELLDIYRALLPQ
jgi:glycosyltransferase involved in cell wall biosynthesis